MFSTGNIIPDSIIAGRKNRNIDMNASCCVALTVEMSKPAPSPVSMNSRLATMRSRKLPRNGTPKKGGGRAGPAASGGNRRHSTALQRIARNDLRGVAEGDVRRVGGAAVDEELHVGRAALSEPAPKAPWDVDADQCSAVIQRV